MLLLERDGRRISVAGIRCCPKGLSLNLLVKCSFLAENEHMHTKFLDRALRQKLLGSAKSVLLLGPRQVGKSTLISSLKPDLTLNLADEMIFLRYSSDPGQFAFDIENHNGKIIFIDEIQRLPSLLNTLQVFIDRNKKLKFFLTGSSARKLRRGQANLLPGRIFNFSLGPIAACELSYRLDTTKTLELGSLPEVYLALSRSDAEKALSSYSALYLKEEIKAEALVRNLGSFARFFQETSLCAGEFVDFTKLAKKSKISRHAIPRYFEILEDTMIGYRLYPFDGIEHKIDLIKHPKFYFFDNGVFNGLLGNFRASADRIGRLSEQLIFSQLLCSSWTLDKPIKISTFRERSGLEVDFLIQIDGDFFAIEVKTSDSINSDDLNGFQFLQKNFGKKIRNSFIFHLGKENKKYGKVWSLPWQNGLKEIGL